MDKVDFDIERVSDFRAGNISKMIPLLGRAESSKVDVQHDRCVLRLAT